MIYHDQDAMETAYLSGEWVPEDADYRPDEGLAFAAGWEAARKFYLDAKLDILEPLFLKARDEKGGYPTHELLPAAELLREHGRWKPPLGGLRTKGRGWRA